MVYKIVCFDVDGTLVDNIVYSWELFHNAFEVDMNKRKHAKEKFYKGEITYSQWAEHDIGMWKEKGVTKKDFEKAMVKADIKLMQGALETIQTILSILEILVPLLDIILSLFKSNPIPSAVPPGVGVPLGIINTIDSKTKTLDDIKLAASVLLRISNKIVSKLIDDLNYQESRLLPIEGLLDSGLSNLTSSQILNLSPQLGYLQGYDYKGFKFFIKEENNPKFVVKGNKRRYATAVNKDGNDVLKSTPSFTLTPDVLIEELKLQIDQKGLVA